MTITSEKEKYSYADYLTWDGGERIKLIDGKVFNISPAPSRRHQQVLILKLYPLSFLNMGTSHDLISDGRHTDTDVNSRR